MSETASLRERFNRALARDFDLEAGDRVVVAVSGGLDSCVLLHLLRFAAKDRLDVVVAHFDHGMRPKSAGDAAWVWGLCKAWGVPSHVERAEKPPSSEAAAREARYDFLERVRRSESAKAVLVAHHADDQAETVLHRVLRGTGIAGLAAIPRSRAPAVARPLLDFWKDDLRAYAREVKLTWREDTSNAELTYVRNAIRHQLLPDAERLIAPGARRALVRLAGLAAEEEAAWRSALARPLEELDVRHEADAVSFSREAFVASDESIRPRLIRAIAARADHALDAAGTRLAVEFSSSGQSGSRVELGDGIELRHELGRLVFTGSVEVGEDRALTIPNTEPGAGDAFVGGNRVPVSWGGRHVEARERSERLEVGMDRFPVVVRARRPGDRIRLGAGTKKLKKVFLEARIPAGERGRIPVVVDAGGDVLWVPGVALADREPEGREGTVLTIGIG